MKNLLILGAFLLFPVFSKAQFKAGQIFFQGGASFSLNDTKYNGSYGSSADKLGNYNHDINYSSGYFTADNRAVGWTLGQSLSLTNFGEYGSTIPSPRTLRSIGFSGGRFVEHYKSLSNKFALYVRPGFGLTYLLQNEDGRQEQRSLSYTKDQTNTFILGVNVSGGVTWLLSPKWALYGGFAFANPISVSAGWNNTATIPINSRGPIRESRGSFFNYNLSPALSSGSINLGFRYLVTRESA